MCVHACTGIYECKTRGSRSRLPLSTPRYVTCTRRRCTECSTWCSRPAPVAPRPSPSAPYLSFLGERRRGRRRGMFDSPPTQRRTPVRSPRLASRRQATHQCKSSRRSQMPMRDLEWPRPESLFETSVERNQSPTKRSGATARKWRHDIGDRSRYRTFYIVCLQLIYQVLSVTCKFTSAT